MDVIKKPQPVDLAAYAPHVSDPETFYGLPQAVHFCRRCVYSNQKPLATRENKHNRDSKKEVLGLDENGVCAACGAIAGKAAVDWAERERELVELCDRHRRSDGRYDCLVPGSGGKDSFFAAHVLKYKYGMNPLTVTWAPHIYTPWGFENFEAWMHAGFDNYLFTPNGLVHRLLTRLAVETIFHPFQPFILGQYYFPPKIAAKLGIPLVFYGEPPTDYGTPLQGKEKAQKDWSNFTERDPADSYLAGVSVKDLVKDFGLTMGDLDAFMPPDPQLIEQAGIDVHYLGYYLKWHPQANYYYSVEHGNFKASPERTAGTYSKYSSIDDKIDDFHYYTTFIKFGIGRATYDAAQEVRLGDISRDEAVALVKRYDGEYPTRFEAENFNYLSIPADKMPKAARMFEQPTMDRDYFLGLCDTFRSPHLWMHQDGEWRLRHRVWDATA